LETSTRASQIDVGVTGRQYDAAVSVLTRYLLTVVTEELQEADPEDWRSSIAIALKDATRRNGVPDRGSNFILRAMNYDPEKHRAVISLEVQHRTGSGAPEMLNTVLRNMGEHPELIAIRRAYIYPAEDEEDVLDAWVERMINRQRFDLAIDRMGAAEWEQIEEVMRADAGPDSYE
jgi:hypothetical protein